MKGLIQKSGYIKPGSGGRHYAEYIATRDGVELMEPTAGGGYLEYMAERPRSHGLFSADGAADLEQTMEEINAHAGPVSEVIPLIAQVEESLWRAAPHARKGRRIKRQGYYRDEADFPDRPIDHADAWPGGVQP